MQRLVIPVLAAAAAVAWPGAAAAKELTQMKICGATDCTTISDRETLRAVPAGGDTPGSPPPAAPFYRVESTVRGEGETFRFDSFYVPSSHMLAFEERGYGMRWFPIWGPEAKGLMRKLVRGIQPFPRPTVTRVTVGGKPVADPTSYLALTTIRPTGYAYPEDADWLPVELRSAQPSPWTHGPAYLYYSPSANILQRGSEMVKVPDDVAKRIEARESLVAPSSGFPLRYAAVALAVLAPAAGAALFGVALARRARAVGQPKPTTA